MRRVFDFILIAAGAMAPACYGQSLLDQVNFQAEKLGGIHLVGISVYSGYSTSAYPQGALTLSNPQLANLGGDMNYGASASVGWQAHGLNGDISVMYSGSYNGEARYSNLNAFGQSLSVSATRKLTPKLTFSLSGSGNDSTVAQYLFQPSTLSVITQVPATFDDLAAAFAAGQFTNAQAASLLTGAPIMQTAGRNLLLGNRVLSYSGQANLSYAATSRLQFHFSSFAAAGQTRLGGQDGIPAVNYVMPRSLGASGGMGFSYSLSPRTELGVDVEESHNLNHFQSVYGSTASASLGRKMGLNWFMSGQLGGSYTFVAEQTVGRPRSRQVIGGGSLGYHAGMHTLVASYNRTSSDSFGFAVGTLSSYSGAWSWHPPTAHWGLSASFGEQQTRNTGFASLTGWEGSGGFNMGLGPGMSLSASYVYMSSSGAYAGTYNTVSVQSVRLALGWSPLVVTH